MVHHFTRWNCIGMAAVVAMGLTCSDISWAQDEISAENTQNMPVDAAGTMETDVTDSGSVDESSVAPVSYAVPEQETVQEQEETAQTQVVVADPQIGESNAPVQSVSTSKYALQTAETQTTVNQASEVEDDAAIDLSGPVQYWGSGIKVNLGFGPSFDVRDPAAGLTGRLGFDIHGKYFGAGLEMDWSVLWAAVGTKRSDHRDMPNRVGNIGLEVVLTGYVPVTSRVVIDLGVGGGFGHRYEKIFSNYSIEEDGSSGIAHFFVGAFWCWEDWTVGMDLELNINNYLSTDYRYWSDGNTDYGIGLVFKGAYKRD